MAIQKVLVPYNFSLNDQKALDFVSRTFSNREDAEVTLFNCYSPPPEIEMKDSPVMEKMKQNLTYLSQRIRENEDELNSVKAKLLDGGFKEAQVHIVFEPRKKDIAGDIIDTAAKGKFNVVVLSRESRKISRFFTASVYNKVVTALKNTAVCIVS